MMHTNSSKVTFKFPFQLPGMTEPHSPGTFEVVSEEEQLDVMWDAKRSSLRIILTYPGREEALPVAAADLEASILQDRTPSAYRPQP